MIRRDGYEFTIKNRKHLNRALGMACLLAMSMACRNFYVYTLLPNERPEAVDEAQEFFTATRMGGRIVCRLTDEVMKGDADGGPDQITETFMELAGLRTVEQS